MFIYVFYTETSVFPSTTDFNVPRFRLYRQNPYATEESDIFLITRIRLVLLNEAECKVKCLK